MSMIEVRVHVPVERETEFYRFFAAWRDAAPEIRGGDAPRIEASLEPAIAWWKSLTAKESAIWSMWVDASPGMVTADAIVQALELKGPREIPGALAWSSRKGARVGFPVDWRFRNDSSTGDPIYGLEDAEYAALIGRARAAAEQSTPRTRVVS